MVHTQLQGAAGSAVDATLEAGDSGLDAAQDALPSRETVEAFIDPTRAVGGEPIGTRRQARDALGATELRETAGDAVDAAEEAAEAAPETLDDLTTLAVAVAVLVVLLEVT